MDVLDLTVLHKRGFLKNHVVEQENTDLLDLTPPAVSPQPSSSPVSESSPALDFLSSFAQVGASTTPDASPVTSAPHTSHYDDAIAGKLDTIINKIEDTMYKIELLSGRVAQIEARFSR